MEWRPWPPTFVRCSDLFVRTRRLLRLPRCPTPLLLCVGTLESSLSNFPVVREICTRALLWQIPRHLETTTDYPWLIWSRGGVINKYPRRDRTPGRDDLHLRWEELEYDTNGREGQRGSRGWDDTGGVEESSPGWQPEWIGRSPKGDPRV